MEMIAALVWYFCLLISSPICVLTLSTSTAGKWKPKVASVEERRKLRGLKHESEKIGSLGFHHVEFYCGDAKSTAYRFSLALGMPIVGTTGQHTGNDQCVSYGLQSGNVRFLLTAPYSTTMASAGAATTNSDVSNDAPLPLPQFSPSASHAFFAKHGLAARAIGLRVKDTKTAFEASIASGAKPVLEPTFVATCPGQKKRGQISDGCVVAEVELYGDVVLRYLSFADSDSENTPPNMPFLPHLSPVEGKMAERETFGIHSIDHAVGNVPDLFEAHNRVKTFTGFHEFAEFTSEDVGTVDSGLNSVVLASDKEHILLPLNEPTKGRYAWFLVLTFASLFHGKATTHSAHTPHTRRKSQIQTYLEQNEGPGLQHLALKTNDIFRTIESMKRAEEELGGFELMLRPSDDYYKELPDRLGDLLTTEQYEKVEKLGLLADADDEGVLLQVFTKPIGDRPTFFFEIIQRIGCIYKPDDSDVEVERPGCGGFGQGNFRELFRSIEELEKTLKV